MTTRTRRVVRLARTSFSQMTEQAFMAICAAGLYGIIQATRMLFADPIRFNGPSFSILRRIPGGMDTWAAAVGFAGVLIWLGIITSEWVLRAGGLLALSIWCGAFGAVAIVTDYTVPTAGPTGGPTYLFAAVLVAILIGYREPHVRAAAP